MRNYLLLFIFITLAACGRYVAAPDDGPETPEWLRAKIVTMESKKYYAGASVLRHEWKSEHYYYIHIPISSCMYCEVYDARGNKIDWTEENVWDYLDNRANEVVIYRREMR